MSNSDSHNKDEKNFTSILIQAVRIPFPESKPAPTREEIKKIAEKTKALFGYKGSLTIPVEETMATIDSRMGPGVSLIDVKAQHNEDWVHEIDKSTTYFDAYEKYLKQEKWSPTVVQALSDVCTKILGHLQNPVSEGNWDRRGLVIGHVQSGKTANYIGLIAKAADAGYKFIIVIAGIHNNLRKQTQERIDEGFIGCSSNPAEKRKKIGVGNTRNYPHPVTLTNIFDDFKKDTARQSGWRINDFSKPVVLVIKKNVSTLASLHGWLKDLNAQEDGQISDVPMLMIDDEADHASINTNKEENDPTKTNRWIRNILSLFKKSCYIGYTATPFANIFINPSAWDKDVREELFPKDFIYCLDAPTSYFGPDKVFLDEDSEGKILQYIDDAENYIPLSHKRDHRVAELPPSLLRAIIQFIIIKAMRNLRGYEKRHCFYDDKCI